MKGQNAEIRKNTAYARQFFTIIELLIVITIIIIIAALFLPTLNGARNKAKNINCLNNLRGYGQMIQNYIQDFNDYLPLAKYKEGRWFASQIGQFGGGGWVNSNTSFTNTGFSNTTLLWNNMPKARIIYCPYWNHDTTIPQTSDHRTSYPTNYIITGTSDNSTGPYKITRLKRTLILLAEAKGSYQWNGTIRNNISLHPRPYSNTLLYTDGHAASVQEVRVISDTESKP